MTPESWVKNLRAKKFWVRKFQTRRASWKENEDGGWDGDEWALNGTVPGFQMFLQKEYPKLSYPVTQWVKKKKRPTASLRPHEFIESGCQGELRDGGVLSLTHTSPPLPHTQELSIGLVKRLSFCPKGPKFCPLCYLPVFFFLKLKQLLFQRKENREKYNRAATDLGWT